jgi:hypothetical protein
VVDEDVASSFNSIPPVCTRARMRIGAISGAYRSAKRVFFNVTCNSDASVSIRCKMFTGLGSAVSERVSLD